MRDGINFSFKTKTKYIYSGNYLIIQTKLSSYKT